MSNIVIAAGGTGGHLFPGIAAGEELLKRGHNIHLLTDPRCQKYLNADLKLIPHIIDCRVSSNKIKSIFSIFKATMQSFLTLHKIKPQVIIGFGGYPTFPPLLAALVLRIPIILHEQNCFMGKTNRFFAKYAASIALSYAETILSGIKAKTIITGDIVRENIKNLPVKKNFNGPVFHIFIFGGSQGAKIFADIIPKAITIVTQNIPSVKLHVTQQASNEAQAEIARIYTAAGVEHQLADFFHDIGQHYAKADLVIARSGASTIAELTTIGLPAIFIPYPFAADNHQFYNAKALASAGSSWLLEQNILTPECLATRITELITDREQLQIASKALLKRKSDGSKILADTVEKIIR